MKISFRSIPKHHILFCFLGPSIPSILSSNSLSCETNVGVEVLSCIERYSNSQMTEIEVRRFVAYTGLCPGSVLLAFASRAFCAFTDRLEACLMLVMPFFRSDRECMLCAAMSCGVVGTFSVGLLEGGHLVELLRI